MPRGPDNVRVCVRWVGAAVTVLALVLLVLNDHVAKQQWPGPVTGKLSDVAGLVVAPPLVALLLSAARLRRPVEGALVLTGLGFTAAKATAVGAAVASAGWSLVTPSHVVADPTDLLTLPALLLAWRTAVWARADHSSTQRRVRLAVGCLMVPFVAVGTAATSACEPHDAAYSVVAVSGRLSTDPASSTGALLVRTEYGRKVLRTNGLQPMAEWDRGRFKDSGDRPVRQACSRDEPARCWRLGVAAVAEVSVDGGRTWTADYAPSRAERSQAVAGLGEKCGVRARFATTDLAVLDSEDGPQVAVTLNHAGIALRGTDGRWVRIPLRDRGAGADTTAPPASGLPLPQDELVPLDPQPPTTSPRPRPTFPTTQPGQTRRPSPSPTTV